MSEEIPINAESNYPPEPLEPPEGPSPKKKRGWPKGKPRGPRKKTIEEPDEVQETPPTPSPAPPEPREPVLEAAPASKPRRSRKGRKSKTGVFVGSEFYSCDSATYEPPWLKCYGGVNEVWVRVDRITTLASQGIPIEVPVHLVEAPRPVAVPPPQTTIRFDKLETNVSGTPDPVEFRRRQNRELESLSGPAFDGT